MRTRHVHLQCSCQHPDHVVRVTLEAHAGERPQLSVQPLLNPHRSLWRRFRVAFRYPFNRKEVGEYWGGWQFEDVILDEEGVRQLTSLVATHNLVVKLQDLKKKRDARKDDAAMT